MPHRGPVEFQGTVQPATSKFGGVLAESPVSKFGGIPFETSISAVPEPKQRFRTTRLGTRVPRPPTRREILEDDFGFDLKDIKGGNVAARLAGSLGDLDDVKRQLAEQFNVEPEDIELGNFEGVGVVFKNPETEKFEPLDVPGVDAPDFAVAGAEAGVIAGEIVAGVAGAIKGGPLGFAAGATFGASVSRAIQLAILESKGIITPEEGEIFKSARNDGILAGSFSLLPTAGRVLKGIFSPTLRALNRLNRTDVTSQGLKEGREQLAPLEEASGARFSAGQRLAQTEEVAGGRLRGTELADPVGSGELERAAVNAEARLSLKLGLIEDSADPNIIGREIASTARQGYLQSVEDVTEAISVQTRKIKQRLAAFAGTPAADAGANIRQLFQGGRDAVFDVLDKQYEALWAKVPAGAKTNMTGLVAVGKKWERKLTESIFPSLVKEDLKLVRDAVQVTTRGSVDPRAGLPPLQLALTPAAPRKRMVTTLTQTRDAITLLKEEIRKFGDPLGGSPLREKRLLGELVGELEKGRDNLLKSLDPDLATQIRQQDRLWAVAKEEIDERLVGAILERKARGGLSKIADDDVFRTIIRNEEGLKDYLRLAAKHDELNAIDDLKKAFDGEYTREVVDGAKSHATWMAQNRRKLELIYSEEGMKRWNRPEQLQEELVRLAKQEKGLIRELQGFQNRETGFVYKLGTYDPHEAVRATKGNPSNARRMMELLNKDQADAFRKVRTQVLLEDTNGSTQALRKKLTDEASREELLTILGEKHVKNLERLLKFDEVDAIEGTVSFLKGVSEPTNIISASRKLIFGPLNRTGYRARVGTRLFPVASDNAIVRMLKDPDQLETLLRLNEERVASKAYWNFLTGTMGLTISDIAAMSENENLGPAEKRAELLKLMKAAN